MCFILIASVIPSVSASEQKFKKEDLIKLKGLLQKKIVSSKDSNLNVIIHRKNDFISKLTQKSINKIAYSARNVKKLKNFVSATVSKEDIVNLITDSSVNAVYLDNEYEIALESSVPLINAPDAWEFGYDGEGVKIAILDTGIDYDNDAFQNRVIYSEVFTGEEHTIDKQGHGTHVAGIAAGNGKYKGVAPAALLLNGKVLTDEGRGSTSSLIAGIEWAVENKADIISLSIGAPLSEIDIPLKETIDNAISKGVVVVAAAGNCANGCAGFYGVTSPGNIDNVITVGAVDDNKVKAQFSSGQDFGTYIKPDVSAPGVNVMSYSIDNLYKSMSGTSMAAPHVAGAAAILLEKNPEFTPAEIKNELESNSLDLGIEGKDIEYGAGLVDLGEVSLLEDVDDESDESELHESYEGFFVTVPVNKEYTEEPELAPDNITVKISSDFETVIADDINSGYFDEDLSSEYSASGTGYISYYDDYTYGAGTSSDGIAWGDSYLEVDLDGYERSTGVICWDWCGDGKIDHCFADSKTDFKECWEASSTLAGYCSKSGVCYAGDMDDEHEIDTGSVGDRWKCTVKSKYYYNCDYEDYDYSTVSKPYYIVSPRQFKCTSDTSGGTYYDGAYFESSSLVQFEKDLSCSSGMACDESKDDSKADFGKYGKSEPDEPCSLKNGYGDCDDDDECMPNSHCSCVGLCWGDFSDDYCCPDGLEWNGNKCSIPCDSSYSYSCSGSYLYKYDACGNRVSSTDCSQLPRVCTSDGGGGAYYGGYCDSSYLKCKYANIDYCNDCSGGYCQNICQLSSASWSTTSTEEKKSVNLNVYGDSDCNGKTAKFNVWEVDCLYDYSSTADCADEPVKINPSSAVFNSGKASTSWVAEWQDDGYLSDPEYYFIADVGGIHITSSNELTVKPCVSQNSVGCYNNDVYYYDGCNNLENIKTDCGEDAYGPYSTNYCSGTNVYKSRAYYDVGCSDGACFNVSTVYPELVKSCGADSCGNYGINYCKGDDVAKNKTCITVGCSKGNCFNTTKIEEVITDCGENYCYKGACVNAYSFIDMVSYNLNPVSPIIAKGDLFRLTYQIRNNGTSAVNIGLGATIRDINNKVYYDESNDVIVNVPVGTYWYQRDFVIPADAVYGKYDVLWGIQKVDSVGRFTGVIKLSDYKNDIVSVIGCGDKICNGIETCTSCTADCGVCPPPDECSTIGYYCEGSILNKCEVSSNGNLVGTFIDSCTNTKYCRPGYASCQPKTAIAKLKLDDAPSGIKVYKQTRDYVTINIIKESAGYVTVNYDSSAFKLESGLCNSQFYLSSDVQCKFSVLDNANGFYYFGINGGNSEKVEVIKYPAALIITNKQKLNERFYGQNSAVDSLMSQAYQTAETKKAVVYDLNQYLAGHPFSSYNEYDEGLLYPTKTDNLYSLDIANFLKEKSNGCKNILILGDDYVVPHYRRDIDWGSWFGYVEDNYNIYTDLPYIQTKTKKFSDLDSIMYRQEDGRSYEGKDVLFILPEGADSVIDDEIDNLKIELTKRYNPDYSEISGSEVVCNDPGFWSRFNGKTLVVVGNEETNRALKCFPFVSVLADEDAAFIEVNPWDGNNFAVVINTNEAGVIKFFADEIIKDGSFKNLQSESAYFFKVGTRTAGYIALGAAVVMIVVGSGGTAAPALLVTAAGIADGVSDGLDATDSCLINRDGWGWCGVSAGFAMVPFIPGGPIKKALKYADKKVLEFVDDGLDFLRKNFDEATIVKTIKTKADEAAFAFGHGRFVLICDGSISELPFNEIKQIEFLKTVGKAETSLGMAEESISNIKFVDSIPGGAPADFNPVKKEIRILKSNSATEVNRVLLYHEYAHAKIFEIFGDVDEFVTSKKISEDMLYNKGLLSYYDEFLADSLAKDYIEDYAMDALKNLDSVASVDVVYHASVLKGEVDQLATQLALARRYDETVYEVMYDSLKTKPDGAKIIKLSELYNNARDFDEIAIGQINEIAELTAELRGYI